MFQMQFLMGSARVRDMPGQAHGFRINGYQNLGSVATVDDLGVNSCGLTYSAVVTNDRLRLVSPLVITHPAISY